MAALGSEIPTQPVEPVEEMDLASAEKLGDLSTFDVTRVASVEPPPNGGWAAWSQVLGGHIITFFAWGFLQSFGMFQSHYTAIGLSSPSNISWIGALEVFFLLSIPLFSGAASDTGHFKLVLRMGILLWLLGIFMMSICTKYWQFVLAQGFCVGIGNGCMFVPMISVVSTYFNATKRSFAMGIVLTGSATGGIVIPIMVNRLIDQIGFGWALRILGFMGLVLLLVAERLLKKRLPPKDSVTMLEPRELKDIVFDLFVRVTMPFNIKILTYTDSWLCVLLCRIVVRVVLCKYPVATARYLTDISDQRLRPQEFRHDTRTNNSYPYASQRHWYSWSPDTSICRWKIYSSALDQLDGWLHYISSPLWMDWRPHRSHTVRLCRALWILCSITTSNVPGNTCRLDHRLQEDWY